jgi:hypothetical protein
MKFGQQVRWVDGNKWHCGTVVANYGNNVWGVTHVMNPDQFSQPEFKVQNIKGTLCVASDGIGMAAYAYTRPNLRQTTNPIPVSQAPVGLGDVMYREQFKRQAGVR